MRCNKHKRYKAKLRPRCDCIECWEIFLEDTATYNDICKELKRRESTGTYAIGFGLEPIVGMLRDYKNKFEEENENSDK